MISTAPRSRSKRLDEMDAELFRKAWELSPSVIMVTKPDGRIEYVNPAFEKVNGYTAGEVVGKNPRILKSGNQKPEVYTGLWKTISSGGTWTGRLQNRSKDGSLYWESATIFPFCGRGGRILHYVAIKENITAEVGFGDMARKAREEAELLAEQSGTVFWRVDADGLYVEVSPACLKVWGYRAEELVGRKHFYDLHPPELQEDIKSKAFRNFKTKKPFINFLNQITTPDGRLVWVVTNGVPILDAAGKLTGYSGTDMDITVLKQAEEALLKSNEEFRAIFEMASIGMFQCDPQTGRWLRVNEKLCRITGYPAAEMLRMKVPDITHPDDRQRDFVEFHRVVRGEVPSHRLEKRYVRKNGELIWVNVNMTVIRDAGGQPVRTMATIEDITDRKRAEDSLRKETLRRQELEQEVLAIAESEQRRIGHDLHDGICQELSGIQYVAELVATRLPGELQEKALIEKTAADIRRVILQTRHLSHSLAPVALESGDLSTALAELAATTERTFGIGCAFACPKPPAISSSSTATHLYRIAQESIQNAIRHGKATSIKISLVPAGPDWMLRVADNGAPARQTKRPGRGLNIMRYRASMFGGALQFHQNAGTTMTCTFSL